MNNKTTPHLNQNIKGVFFDLYGTLLVFDNFDEADNVWVNTFYDLTGKKNNLSISDVRKICTEVLETSIEKDSPNGLTTYETKIKKGFEEFGVYFSNDKLRKLADETVGTWQINIRLADDALPVLTELKKNKKVVLITNFDHSPHIKRVIAKTALDNIFDLVVISDEAGFKKPDPKIFQSALSKLNLLPQEVVYIGDNIYDDVEGAFAAGIKPILISRKVKSYYNNNGEDNSNTKGLPEFQIINSLSELIPLFN